MRALVQRSSRQAQAGQLIMACRLHVGETLRVHVLCAVLDFRRRSHSPFHETYVLRNEYVGNKS